MPNSLRGRINYSFPFLLLFLTLGVGAFLRLSFLGTRPLDGDEGVILAAATQPTLGAVIDRAAADVHPPAQAVITYLFLRIVPLSETTARLPSVAASLVALVGIYLLASTYFGRSTGLLTLALAALSPYLLIYAQEQRMYSLLLAAGVWSIVAAERLRTPSPNPKLWWGVFIAAGTILAYTHFLGLLILGAIGLGWLVDSFRARRIKWPVLLGLGVIGLFYLPYLSQAVAQFAGRSAEQAIGPDFGATLVGLMNALLRFGLGRLVLGIDPTLTYFMNLLTSQPGIAILLGLGLMSSLIMLGAGLRSLWRRRGPSLELPALILAIFLLAAFASQSIGSPAVRTLILLVPFYLMLTALGIQALARPPLGRFVIGLFVVTSLAAILKMVTVDYRAAGADRIAATLAREAQDGDIVLARGAFLTGESFVLAYYLDRQPRQPRLTLVDYYGDYRIGNLRNLRAKSLADYSQELRAGSDRTLWYFSFEDTPDQVPASAIAFPLGLTKDLHPLVLYKIQGTE